MALPRIMTCIEVSAPGGADTLRLAERPVPTPAKGQVLIHVSAAGINRPDVLQRQGVYPPPPGASDLLGLEVAGTVVACGEDVSESRIGEPVCALVAGGGYAEYAVADARHCLPIPPTISMVEAAALPETLFTVWHNVFERGGLKAGESLLIHGGAGGIGTTAIQMAGALGATVFTTAGGADKCHLCAELGAKRAIDYQKEDFVAVLKTETAGRGVDVILDMIGGEYIARNIKVLATDGRLVSIAFLKGSVTEMNFMPVMLRRLTLTGSTLRPQSDEAKARMAEGIKTSVWPLVAEKKIRAVIDTVFPLAQAAEAHQLMENNTHKGKIVLTT